MIQNALSVDVEDWFQVGAFERTISRSDWDSLPHRVERNSDCVLALLDDAGIKATFFTLGWVAERYPALMRRIADAGHEIASHGYDHRRVFTFTPEEFRNDLKKSRELIENTSGKQVTGYRAPSFSIDARTPWAHEVLAQEGYAYSSSVARASPTTAPRQWPICMGPVGLAETYSTLTRVPPPMSDRP